jgi:hypothetical protein
VQFIFKSKFNFWLAISIAVAILFSLAGLKLAFHSPYTIQDDARQHVFWMQQFSDHNLFNNDLIANYFSSVAPLGYKNLYLLVNSLGLEPFLFNKILPVIMGIVTTIYLFLVCLEIFPIPFAGFIATLLLNQNIWMLDDLVSGTPRAFFYPLFVGFIYYLLRRSLLPCLLFIALQGLFYPQVLLISATILVISLGRDRVNYSFYLIALFLAIAILAIYKLQTAEFSEVISLKEAKLLPEFYAGGRNAFFSNNPLEFWLYGKRSGFFPYEWQYVLLCSFGLCLPILQLYPRRFTLVTKINNQIEIIWLILFASLLLFTLAHLLLFQLHLPSRYSQHSLRIIIALIDGIAIAIILNSIANKITNHKKILKPLITFVVIAALLYPTYAVQAYPYRLGYVTGKATRLYKFLQQQPKNSLIASLSKESDFIPSLAQRSVLVAEEYSIPYHQDYYQQIRQRAKDLIKAEYSDDPEEVKQFIREYGLNLWLLDKNTFTVEYLKSNGWLMQFQPEANSAIAILEQSKRSILSTKTNSCQIFQEAELILLDAQCIIQE